MFAKGNRLGSGIHASAYENLENPNTVIIETTERIKVEFVAFLGLVVSPIEECKDCYGDTIYVYEAVRLESLRYSERYTALRGEIQRVRKAWRTLCIKYDCSTALKHLYRMRGLFPTHKLAIEFAYLNDCTGMWFDSHDGNYLACPVTGYIFPYDCIMF